MHANKKAVAWEVFCYQLNYSAYYISMGIRDRERNDQTSSVRERVYELLISPNRFQKVNTVRIRKDVGQIASSEV